MPIQHALRRAEEYDLDLVEVAPNSEPPVCRIMDYSKFKYEQEKKERETRKHQHQSQIKEIRLRPHIDGHDYQTKLNHVKEFLAKGHKVKIRIMFRGREMAHKELGDKITNKLIEDLKTCAKIEKPPQSMGWSIIVIFAPAKNK